MSTPSDRNPYQPPKADVTPPPEAVETAELLDEPRSLPAGNGTTWIGDGFKLFGRSAGIWIVITIVYFLLSIILAFIPFLGSFASALLTPVIVGGLMLGCRSLDSGGPLQVGHLFSGFSEKAGQLILVGVLMLVAYFVLFFLIFIGVLVIFGSAILQHVGNQQALTQWLIESGLESVALLVLIVIALAIPLAMAYWFAPALVVFHNLEPFAAMKKSFQGCLRNFVPFLLYGLVFLVLAIIAVIPIGLGLLVLFPVMYASMYASYKDIFLKQ